MRYIRQFVRVKPRGDSVLAHANVSRRVLEKRSRHALGCSVDHKTREARVQLATTTLTKTQMSISQIACEPHFPDAAQFSPLFP
jgi:transcriptional regulator GlxA family with amidase domain